MHRSKEKKRIISLIIYNGHIYALPAHSRQDLVPQAVRVGPQEAILKAFKRLSRFRQEAKFSTWLIQIAINEAKMKLRKDRRHLYESLEEGQRTDDGDYIPKDFAEWREIPSEALEQKDLRDALTKALNSLPDKYRTVLILRDVQQLSIAETARALRISEANVKTRLLRARLQMRDALAPGFDGAWNGGREYERVRPF